MTTETVQTHIVVGTDGSDGSLHAVRVAADEARRRGGSLEVICAWHPGVAGSLPAFGVGTPVAETLDELTAALRDTLVAEGLGPDGDVPVVASVVTGHAAEVLVDASRNAALIVVGTRGRGGFAGLVLGSVSHQVAAHAHCPVMVVPPA
jgi:nucleotide-binding universal stress UspA family protein